MELIYTRSYNQSLKKLNKRKNDLLRLNTIINYLYNVNSFIDLENNPLANMYGFERLKYKYNMCYSFRISNKIRLIVIPNDNNIKLYLVFISIEHYSDFNMKKVIIDE